MGTDKPTRGFLAIIRLGVIVFHDSILGKGLAGGIDVEPWRVYTGILWSHGVNSAVFGLWNLMSNLMRRMGGRVSPCFALFRLASSVPDGS